MNRSRTATIILHSNSEIKFLMEYNPHSYNFSISSITFKKLCNYRYSSIYFIYKQFVGRNLGKI